MLRVVELDGGGEGGHRVFLAKTGGQNLGQLAIDKLGHVGAIAGNEGVELVDVDDHHRQLAVVAPGEGELLAGVVVQVGLGGEARCRVDRAGGGKRRAALLQVALGARKLGERLEAGQQFNVADALGDEVRGPGALGLDPDFRLVVTGYHHHRQGADA